MTSLALTSLDLALRYGRRYIREPQQAQCGSDMRSAVLTAALVAHGTVSLATPAARVRERPVAPITIPWVESGYVSAFQAESSGVLAGRIIDARDGRPVPYATVLLLGTDVAEFADSNGAFRLNDLVPGSYTLRARQIGYFPKDTALTIAPGTAATTVALRLTQFPALMPLVKVRGRRPRGCVATGIPDSTVNPSLAAVFSQVRENVDRFRLLLERYPFRYHREEQMLVRFEPGGDVPQYTDTVAYESRTERPYRVGGIVFVDSDAIGRRHRRMELPTFRDLADSTFLSTHCFSYAGVERLGGRHGPEVVRVDFRPASSIAVPDVEGSVYLDAKRDVVRRAEFRMTRPSAARPPVLAMSVTTTFREIAPLVPVFDSIESDQRFGRLSSDPFAGITSSSWRFRSAIGDYRVVDAAFERRTIGEQDDRMPAGQRTVTGTTAEREAVPETSRPAATGAAAELTGRVVDAKGGSVPRADVTLLGGQLSTTTDDSGRFVLRDMRPGPYMLAVQRTGVGLARVPVTITTEYRSAVTVTLAVGAPERPKMALSAPIALDEEAYHAIGLDRRMRDFGEPLETYAGGGYFLTAEEIHEQIQQHPGVTLSGLLRGTRPFIDWPQSAPGAQLIASACVAIAIDGVPQAHLSGTSAGPLGAVDNLIGPSAIGAIEAYPPGGRSTEYAGLDPGSGRCAYVLIWTRAFLGLSELPDLASASEYAEPRARAALPNSAECNALTPADSVDLTSYMTLHSATPGSSSDTLWWNYDERVLAGIRRAFVAPTELPLPVFADLFGRIGPMPHQAPLLRLVPSASGVVGFALDSTGAVVGLGVLASSLSGAADTAYLAAIAQGGATHSFPHFTLAERPSGPRWFVLFASGGEHGQGVAMSILTRMHLPAWPASRRVSLMGSPQRVVLDDAPAATSGDSATVEFVVDEHGRAVPSTARIVARDSTTEQNALPQSLVRALQQDQFQSAEIGVCAVPHLFRMQFSWRQ